jgi:hypothetical protein
MKLTDILSGGGLRMTSDTPVKYAVLDVLQRALGEDACRSTLAAMYTKLCKQHDLWPQEFAFFSPGRRPTPVCTGEQAELLMQLLPGRRAATFRATGEPGSKAKRVEHLYVMRYDFDDSKVKIGKSWNPEQRRRSIEAQQDFLVETLCVFPAKGCMEKRVHKALKGVKSKKGRSKEWFKISTKDAVAVVSRLLQEFGSEPAEGELEPNEV